MRFVENVQPSLREAMFIILTAAVLGLSYTFFMHKGIFSTHNNVKPRVSKSVPPEFISFDEAVALYKSNAALFVDARHNYDYNLGHIAGAINVPLENFDFPSSRLADTAKDRVIITYCDGAECNSSIELAKKLSEAGFTNVKMFFGGWTEWQQQHQRTEQ